jgi:tyrosyl-tRNA synthetase
MLIQGYDFYKLYADQWVKLQIAGSDQWGNVTTGTEIIRKKTDGGEAYAFTCPLVLDSNGKKFWKSEGNAIWLDSTKNSPYFVYQYFLNVADADVERFLKLFTFYDFDTIDQIVATHNQDTSLRHGQSMLAEYVVKLIFWPEAARQAQMITNILFGRGDVMETIRWLSIEDIEALQSETGWYVMLNSFQHLDPETSSGWQTIIDLLVQSWLASSNGEAKKLIQWGGIYVNEQKVEDIAMTVSSSDAINGMILLRKGKKGYRVVRVN